MIELKRIGTSQFKQAPGHKSANALVSGSVGNQTFGMVHVWHGTPHFGVTPPLFSFETPAKTIRGINLFQSSWELTMEGRILFPTPLY